MPIAIEAQQCGNCKFWKLEPLATHRATVEVAGKEPEIVVSIVGLCRESPPRQDSFTESGFSRTRETTWCGHWKESSVELLARTKTLRATVIPEPATPHSADSQTSTQPAPAS